MKCSKVSFFIFLWILFLGGICPNDVFSSTQADYLKQKNKFLNKDKQNRNILAELYQAQTHIRKLHNEKSKIKLKMDASQRNLDKIAPLVNQAESTLISQKIQIQKRLMYILKFQDMSFLKIVFSSQTPSEMDRNLRILKNVTEKDYISLKSYFQNVKALLFKKKELVAKRDEFEKLSKNLEHKEAELNKKTEEKNWMLSHLQKQQKNLLSSLKKMRSEGQNVSSEKKEFLDTLFEPLFFERKGSLILPVKGSIYQGYGVLEHPIYKTQFRHKGVFIRSESGFNVRAVAKGKISYSADMQGLGHTLILDHGDHFFSIYSHIKNVSLKIGDTVEEGSVFAQIGLGNPFFGEGLYFELRHFSEPVNPQEWFQLKKTAKRTNK